jgi:hypothetical protein
MRCDPARGQRIEERVLRVGLVKHCSDMDVVPGVGLCLRKRLHDALYAADFPGRYDVENEHRVLHTGSRSVRPDPAATQSASSGPSCRCRTLPAGVCSLWFPVRIPYKPCFQEAMARLGVQTVNP